MQTVILVIHLLLAIALVGTVLLQRSEGGGLGIGGGGGLMSVRGTANLLTRVTGVLAAAFMVTSIVLAIMAGTHTAPRSILETPAGTAAPAKPEAPAKPSVPLSQ
ncbi:MAG: preprotein translocase subunit SecG [Alphaproteobacteria bacterium]|nr:preprotein translocase subunit SecG [Alphaproteobacteria bacterium]